MHIAIGKITLRLPANHSLKGKRKVVKSLCERLKNHFNISVGEVADNDVWQLATLGFACVSNDSRYLAQIVNEIQNFIQTAAGEYELINQDHEILSGF